MEIKKKKGKGILRVGCGSKENLIPLYSLTNMYIQKYHHNESRFHGVCSGGDLSKNIKDGACEINLDEYASWNSLDCFVCFK